MDEGYHPPWENIAQELFLCKYHKDCHHTRELTEYYNIKEGQLEEEEDLRNINIQESEGFREVQEPMLSDVALEYSKPMKITKVNIRMPKNPKLVIIGDYWEK